MWIIHERRQGNLRENERPNKHNYYLNIAKAVSERSTCLVRHYGAIIVANDEVIATGYNGAPRGVANCCDAGICQRYADPDFKGVHGSGYEKCVSVHAEMNAMLSASRKDLIGSTLYLYGYDTIIRKEFQPEPCPICTRLIKNSGIEKVVTWEV